MTAGMSLPEANLEPFRAAFAAEVAARAGGEVLRGVIHSDGELRPDEMCIATARALKRDRDREGPRSRRELVGE